MKSSHTHFVSKYLKFMQLGFLAAFMVAPSLPELDARPERNGSSRIQRQSNPHSRERSNRASSGQRQNSRQRSTQPQNSNRATANSRSSNRSGTPLKPTAPQPRQRPSTSEQTRQRATSTTVTRTRTPVTSQPRQQESVTTRLPHIKTNRQNATVTRTTTTTTRSRASGGTIHSRDGRTRDSNRQNVGSSRTRNLNNRHIDTRSTRRIPDTRNNQTRDNHRRSSVVNTTYRNRDNHERRAHVDTRRHVRSHHQHGPSCGHYYHTNRWYDFPATHRHHSGCGHHRVNDIWVSFSISHRHSRSCGHFFDGFSWVIGSPSFHVHAHGCGHHFYDRSWHMYPRSYYTMYRPNSFYFFVDLGNYTARNLPTYVYERNMRQSEIDVLSGEDSVSIAYASFSRGLYYNSLLAFNNAINSDPENGLLYLARAQTFVAVKDYRSAYDDLVTGMTLIPEWTEIDLDITEVYADTEDLLEQTETLERWVAKYPTDFKAHFVLGYLYYFQKDYAAAKNELIFTLSWDGEHQQAHGLMDNILELEANETSQ